MSVFSLPSYTEHSSTRVGPSLRRWNDRAISVVLCGWGSRAIIRFCCCPYRQYASSCSVLCYRLFTTPLIILFLLPPPPLPPTLLLLHYYYHCYFHHHHWLWMINMASVRDPTTRTHSKSDCPSAVFLLSCSDRLSLLWSLSPSCVTIIVAVCCCCRPASSLWSLFVAVVVLRHHYSCCLLLLSSGVTTMVAVCCCCRPASLL